MSAYYNERDAFAAAWLRLLMKAGVIADGEVDERDIRQIEPADLRGFAQCHFFAGIGVWSHALRAAGWPDDSPVWTGSCPCQGFSASGKRGGFSDQRHLWPAWFRLIGECAPDIIFGEQVASDDGLAWLDLVSADLEGAGYACGAADTCAAGFGAPHIRSRLYFVAHAGRSTDERQRRRGEALCATGTAEGEAQQRQWSWDSAGDCGEAGGGLAHSQRDGRRPDLAGREAEGREALANTEVPDWGTGECTEEAGTGANGERRRGSARGRSNGELGHAINEGLEGHARNGDNEGGRKEPSGSVTAPSYVNGFWSNAHWLWCRDQKWRPVEPGTFPLAHGAANRVGRLRGYGNALCAPQAIAFIQAAREVLRG